MRMMKMKKKIDNTKSIRGDIKHWNSPKLLMGRNGKWYSQPLWKGA